MLLSVLMCDIVLFRDLTPEIIGLHFSEMTHGRAQTQRLGELLVSFLRIKPIQLGRVLRMLPGTCGDVTYMCWMKDFILMCKWNSGQNCNLPSPSFSHVPGTVLGFLEAFAHLTLLTTLWDRCLYYSHAVNENSGDRALNNPNPTMQTDFHLRFVELFPSGCPVGKRPRSNDSECSRRKNP